MLSSSVWTARGFDAPKVHWHDGERGMVACSRCGAPIVLARTASVAEEFSLPCRHCGYRGIYRRTRIERISAEG
jgi:DNA-directed RNA polymerase subunit RPC12/RpoP